MDDDLPRVVALQVRLLALVDADPGGALYEAEELLAPLDANLELEPYAVPCPCIEMRADDVSCDFAAEARALRDPEKRLRIAGLMRARSVTEEEEREIEEDAEEFERLFQSYKEIYLRNRLTDPDCEACDGTGLRRGLHNPEGRWFSWEVVEDSEGFGGDSCVAAGELSLAFGGHRFWALLTPDGRWLEMRYPTQEEGETDESHDERLELVEEAWEREIREQLRRHARCTAVSIRCLAAIGNVDLGNEEDPGDRPGG